MSALRPLALVLAALCLAPAALAQMDDGAPPDYVAVKAFLDRDAYHPGESARVVVEMKIDPRVHVNTNAPSEDYQFPTSIEWTEEAGLKPGAPTWPKGVMKAFEFTEGKKIGVYEGTQRVTLSIAIPAGIAPGAKSLIAKIKAQGCTHTTCYAPQTDELKLLLRVVAAGEPTAAVNEERFASAASPADPGPAAEGAADGAGHGALAPAPAGVEGEAVEVAEGAVLDVSTVEPPAGAAATASELEAEEPTVGSDDVSAVPGIAEGEPTGRVPSPAEPGLQCPEVAAADDAATPNRSLWLVYLFTFLGGLALAFTPCVLPLVPITIGFFSRQQEGGRRPVVPAILYVLGLAAVYSALGTVAALSGGLFGSLLQKPIVLVGVAAILFALALSMFGIWDLNLPPSISNRIGGSRAGNAGAFAMGGAMGLVAAPCVGPLVVSLLTYVAELGSRFSTAKAAFMGGSLFFALAVGMGVPFFLVALGAGSLRPGQWMVTVKKLFGFVILGVVLWFLRPLIGALAFQWGLVLLLAASGIYFLVHARSPEHGPRPRTVFTSVGVAAMIAMIGWTAYVMRSHGAGSAMHHGFRDYTDDLLARAKADGIPVVIDFSAEWCIACKELEHQTFPDSRVQERLKEFVPLRSDLTDDESEETQALYKKWKIRGLPTIVFLDSEGNEIKPLRLSGFESPADFANRLDCAQAIDVAAR